MAAPPSICRLCVTTSNDDFKNLYNDYCQPNGLYEMTYEYFHPKIVDLEKAKHLTAICLECFRHIHDFHSFQTSIIVAQLKLIEEDKSIYTITEDIKTPRRDSLTETMTIKVEEEEFIELPPNYVLEENCPQIMKDEFINLSDIQIEDYSPSTSKNNHQINEEEGRKDNISLSPLEIMDIDTSSKYISDDEIPLAQLIVRKPPLSKDRNTDGVGAQIIDDQKLSHDQDPMLRHTNDEEDQQYNISLYEVPLAQDDATNSSPTQKIDNQISSSGQKEDETLEYLLSKWIPNIKCFKCTNTFSSWPFLKRHIKRQHPNEKFHYLCCSRKFNRFQIKDHLRHHSDPDIFKCSLCGKRYDNNRSLGTHYHRKHPESLKYQCDMCGTGFVSNHALATHQHKHKSDGQHIPDMDRSDSVRTQTIDNQKSFADQPQKKYKSLEYLHSLNSSDQHYIPDLQINQSRQSTSKDNNETTLGLPRQGPKFQKVDMEEHRKDNLTLSKIDLCPQPMSEGNNETTERLPIHDSVFHIADEEEDRKYNISLPPLEIMDVDSGSTSSSDDEIPLAQIDDRNLSVSKSFSSDAVVIQTTDDQKSTHDHDQPGQKHDTFEYLRTKWIPNIKCFECSKSFPSWSMVKGHFKQAHSNEKFYYICCSRKFSIFRIKDHLLLHDDPEALTCSMCNKRYTNSSNLASHYGHCHPESLKFLCNICNRRCFSKVGLALHCSKMHSAGRQDIPDHQMHHSPRPISEDNNETTISLSIPDDETPLNQILDRNPCFSKRRSSDGVLTQTIDSQKSTHDQPQINHESLDYLLAKWIPNIKCFKCSKSFSSWPLVKSHFRKQHHNEKFYYICCSRKFKLSTIKDHLRLHSNPEAFKCFICQIRYKSMRNLAAHNAKTHTESLKFFCDKCGKRFRSKVGLTMHISNIHHSNRPDHAKVQLMADGRSAYCCQLCGETKYCKRAFKSHASRIHGIATSRVVCTICGEISFSACRFREHMAAHENKKIYKCSFCPKTFRRIYPLRMHRKFNHPLESGKNYYINIAENANEHVEAEDSESESDDCSTSAKSTTAAPAKNDDFGEDKPPIAVIGAADLQDSEDNINRDHKTLAKWKREDVNTDSETSCNDEIEQEYSISSVLIKNEDCGEECTPTTSMAAAVDQQINENKTNKMYTTKVLSDPDSANVNRRLRKSTK